VIHFTSNQTDKPVDIERNVSPHSPMEPPLIPEGEPHFEEDVRSDLLQLMQEAAMEAEGLTSRPLPDVPKRTNPPNSAHSSRSDRTLPNPSGTAVDRATVESVVRLQKQQQQQQQQPGLAHPVQDALSAVDTISPDDSISMVAQRAAFRSLAGAALPPLQEMPEHQPMPPIPHITRPLPVAPPDPPAHLKRLSLPVTSNNINGYSQVKQPVNHISQAPLPSSQMPIGQAQPTFGNIAPQSHSPEFSYNVSNDSTKRYSMPAPRPITSVGHSHPIVGRPLPPVPRARGSTSPVQNNNQESTAPRPPQLLPKPPKSVISSVIGIPRPNIPTTIQPPHSPGANNQLSLHYGPPSLLNGTNTARPVAGPMSPIPMPQPSIPPQTLPIPSYPSTAPPVAPMMGPSVNHVAGPFTPSSVTGMPLIIPGARGYAVHENSVEVLNSCINVRDIGSKGIDFSGKHL
jgi:hypothetical protein